MCAARTREIMAEATEEGLAAYQAVMDSPTMGRRFRCRAAKRKYKQKEKWVFSTAGSRSCWKCLLFVCLSVHLLWVGRYTPALGGSGGARAFHQGPKRAFDPRGTKKCSIIKRFNCVWIFAFPPGGANLLWSQKLILLKDKKNFKLSHFLS